MLHLIASFLISFSFSQFLDLIQCIPVYFSVSFDLFFIICRVFLGVFLILRFFMNVYMLFLTLSFCVNTFLYFVPVLFHFFYDWEADFLMSLCLSALMFNWTFVQQVYGAHLHLFDSILKYHVGLVLLVSQYAVCIIFECCVDALPCPSSIIWFFWNRSEFAQSLVSPRLIEALIFSALWDRWMIRIFYIWFIIIFFSLSREDFLVYNFFAGSLNFFNNKTLIFTNLYQSISFRYAILTQSLLQFLRFYRSNVGDNNLHIFVHGLFHCSVKIFCTSGCWICLFYRVCLTTTIRSENLIFLRIRVEWWWLLRFNFV